MRILIALALTGLACLTTGCRAIAAASDVARQYEELKPRIEAAVAAGKEAVDAAKSAADAVKREVAEIKQVEATARAGATRPDGTIDWGSYASLLALGMAEYMRRKTNTLQAQTDQLYDATHKPKVE